MWRELHKQPTSSLTDFYQRANYMTRMEDVEFSDSVNEAMRPVQAIPHSNNDCHVKPTLESGREVSPRYKVRYNNCSFE